MKKTKRFVLPALFVAVLGVGMIGAAQAQGGRWHGDGQGHGYHRGGGCGMMFEGNHGSRGDRWDGRDLLTESEWTNYRQQLDNAKTYQEYQEVRFQHHRMMNQRAAQRAEQQPANP